jgi:signal transduction histidine kinase
MFSIIGHDLRGPVGTIKSFLDLIIENPELTNEENTFEILKTMQQSLGSAYALLDNLLLWARSQRGQLEFVPSSFYIRQPIDEILNLVSDSARNKNISIESTINYNGLVFADQNMITTVLRNLVSNAIKFTQKGGKIVLSTSLIDETLNGIPNKKIEIQVTDNGIGINESDIDKILEVNEIYSTPGTDKESGSGLGIGICIDFLKKHNQKLYINNNKDITSVFEKGSTFRFYLEESMPIDEEID